MNMPRFISPKFGFAKMEKSPFLPTVFEKKHSLSQMKADVAKNHADVFIFLKNTDTQVLQNLSFLKMLCRHTRGREACYPLNSILAKKSFLTRQVTRKLFWGLEKSETDVRL